MYSGVKIAVATKISTIKAVQNSMNGFVGFIGLNKVSKTF